MPEGDPFERWISDFRREVDVSLEKAPAPSLATPEARQAQQAFDQWWSAEQQPVTQPAPSLALDALEPKPAPPAAAPRESVLAHEWPLRLERLADERARLHERAERSEEEARALRERVDGVQSEIAAMETKLSRARERYEEHIKRLEEAARAEQARREEQREARAGLEAALKRAQDEQAALRAQLEAERARADGAEGRALELRKRLELSEKRGAELEKAAAAQEGALAELRRQSSVYSQRMVQAKELTDNDVMSMRQDLKSFLEELRLLRGSIRKGE